MKHNNISIGEDALRIFKTKTGDNISSEVLPYITPVIPVKRKGFVQSVLRETTGNMTLFTTSPAKETYITGVVYGMAKDAANDMPSSRIYATINGVQTNLAYIPLIPLTADVHSITINFDSPILLDKNTPVISTGTYTAGTAQRFILVTGYLVE